MTGTPDGTRSAPADLAEGLHLGFAALAERRDAEVEARMRELIARHPHDPRPHFLLGSSLHLQERLAEALASFEQASALDPGYAEAHSARAGMLARLGRLDEALAGYVEAARLAPSDVQVATNIAVVLQEQGRHAEALAQCETVLRAEPAHAPALMNRGWLLTALGRLDEAVSNNRHFAVVHPEHPEAHFNLAEVLLAARDYAGALAASEACLALAPGHVKAAADRGLALAALGRLDEAGAAIAAASAMDPQVWSQLGGPHEGLDPGAGEPPDPRVVYLVLGQRRLARCDWRDYDAFVARYRELVLEGGVGPHGVADRGLLFECWALPVAAEVQPVMAANVAARIGARLPPRVWVAGPPGRGERLRIGYLSPDFAYHAAGFAAAALFRRHDPARFELRAYALTDGDGSPVDRTVRAHAEEYVPLRGLSDADAAYRIYRDDCDVLVDLAGYTRDARPAILAHRPAPVQVTFTGYYGVMGGDLVDYHVTSAGCEPPRLGHGRLEARALLPCTHFLYDDETVIRGELGRADAGLPAGATVFACFNQWFKLGPRILDVWARILRAVPGGVLWLLAGDPEAERNLRAETTARGVDPRRLVVAPRIGDHALHLARHRLADLFLDTLWFGGHTTACDALWAGVPVLTVEGGNPYSRLCACFLRALDMPELVTRSTDEYEALAVALARDPARLAATRSRLAARRLTTPLFDSAARVAHLERAYEEMVRRCRAGEPAADLSIEARRD